MIMKDWSIFGVHWNSRRNKMLPWCESVGLYRTFTTPLVCVCACVRVCAYVACAEVQLEAFFTLEHLMPGMDPDVSL